MKANCKKIKEFIKDESLGSKEYVKYGFPQLAKDERKHKRFLTKQLKKCK